MAWIIKRDKKENDSLMHYGTKGMRWGERQYQYEDGRYTPAGKERYKKDSTAQNRIATREMVKTTPVVNVKKHGSVDDLLGGAVGYTEHDKQRYKNARELISATGLQDFSDKDTIEYEYYDQNGHVKRTTSTIGGFMHDPILAEEDRAINIVKIGDENGDVKYSGDKKLQERIFTQEVHAVELGKISKEELSKLLQKANNKKVDR